MVWYEGGATGGCEGCLWKVGPPPSGPICLGSVAPAVSDVGGGAVGAEGPQGGEKGDYDGSEGEEDAGVIAGQAIGAVVSLWALWALFARFALWSPGSCGALWAFAPGLAVNAVVAVPAVASGLAVCARRSLKTGWPLFGWESGVSLGARLARFAGVALGSWAAGALDGFAVGGYYPPLLA